MMVGQILLEVGRGVKLEAVAYSLDVSVRTLTTWKRNVREAAPERKLGRPPHTSEAHQNALWFVGQELERQGYPGWRVISRGLQGRVPDRLIQIYVRRFKLRRKERKMARIARNRVSVTVLARDAIWGQDGSHIGRTKEHALESQVIRDRGSLAFVGVESGPTADHLDVLKLFKATVRRRGGRPLVYSRDNGSMYAHKDVESYMAKQQIIVLRSLPRVSQHNGATERSIRELKDATGLGKGEWIEHPADAYAAMTQAAVTLNEFRIRPSKGFKTANELDDTLPVGYNCGRDHFYKQCRQSMAKAVQGVQGKRAARFAEREAIFSTLEKFGLIKRSRGGKPYVQKQEVFS